MAEQPRYRPGEQPYDRMVGARIGAIVGGIVAIVPGFVVGGGFIFFIAIGALAGGYAGWWWASRELDRMDGPGGG